MIRTLIWWPLFTLTTVVFSSTAIITGLFDWSGRLPHFLNRFWARIVTLASGAEVSVEGVENLIKGSGQIIVANHQSGFDIYILTAFLPVQLRWIAKKELFYIPFMGWGMWFSRYIPIDRSNPRKAMRSLARAAEYISRGFTAVIFPEGTRTRDGSLGEFKKGTLFMARKGELPILPVTISGTFNIQKKGSFRIQPEKVKVIIDKPVSYEEIRQKGERQVLLELRGLMENNLRNN